jgi:two-component system, LytTR family, sensor kinase
MWFASACDPFTSKYTLSHLFCVRMYRRNREIRVNMNETSPAKPIRYPSFGVLFVAWTLIGVLAYAHYTLVNGNMGKPVLPELLAWLTCYYPWLILTPLVFTLERNFPLSRLRWTKSIGILVLAGLFVSYAASVLAVPLDAGIDYAFRRKILVPSPWWKIPRTEFALQLMLYFFTVGAGCLIRNAIALRQKERLAAQLALEKSQLESSLHQAELETLRMRLNPHFLFNCLQNISTLSRDDPQTASQMLTRLGDLLRVALRRDSQAETILEAELSLTQAYVSIEKMRFAERLSVLLDIAPDTEMAMVPSFVLQPLVENAIKHGLRGAQKNGVIWIRSSQQDDQLTLTVSDNGAGVSEEELSQLNKGIGLDSTCERLKRMYPDQHTFSIRRLPEGGTEVRIVIPLRFKEAVRQTTSHESPQGVDRR